MSAPRRPLSLTITILGIFLLAVWNLWRAWIVAQQSALLIELGVTFDPRLRLALAIVWATIFLWLAVGLWQRRQVARILLPATVLLYGGYHLLLLLFTPAPAARQGWALQLVFLIGAAGWSLWVSRRGVDRKGVARDDQKREGFVGSRAPLELNAVQRGDNDESKN